MRVSSWLESLLIGAGCVCLAAVGMRLVDAASFQRTAAQTFERELAAVESVTPELAAPAPAELSGRESAADVPVVRGLIDRLEIPRLDVSVIVMEGDDNGTLARAVGHLPDTALPWELGNAVIAGHRDTFFRPLQHAAKVLKSG